MYIDEAGGSPLGAGIGKSMDQLAHGAASGAFAVNEQGGDALLAAIRDMAAWVDGEGVRLDILRQEAMLGNSSNAQVMKPYLKQVAEDGEGFITQLREFRESLVKAEEAIIQAMANYRSTDSGNAGSLRA
ncbi:MAG: hypothetical protein M3443_07125 [Actinomycetota bacterium]|nr:hypothetical protein [Actinomycetota bacterium]